MEIDRQTGETILFSGHVAIPMVQKRLTRIHHLINELNILPVTVKPLHQASALSGLSFLCFIDPAIKGHVGAINSNWHGLFSAIRQSVSHVVRGVTW